MKKILIVMSILLATVGAFAQSNQTQTTSEAVDKASNLGLESGELQKSIDNAQEEAKSQNKIIEEAVSAIKFANDAVADLDKKDSDAALKALEAATGKLEIVVATNPDLALAPVDVAIEIYDSGITTVDEAHKILRLARVALNDNDAVSSRILLESLASEIRVRNIYLPLEAYPNAMLKAAGLIKQGKPDEAKEVIVSALNTLVVSEEVLPLPVISAQALLDQTEKDIDANDIESANKNLESARDQLKLAKAMGYASFSYSELDDQLIELKRLVKAKEPHKSALAKLRDGISNLLHHKK